MDSRARRWLTAAVVALGLSLVVIYSGCILTASRGRPVTVDFSHRVHLAEKLDCTDCHKLDSETGDYGSTTPDVCRICHVKRDAALPPEQHFIRLYLGKSPKGPFFTRLGEEIFFSHAQHEGDAGCSECHANLIESEEIEARHRTSKPECMECHRRQGASNLCQTCHRRVREDSAPANHDQSWLRLHGSVSNERHELCTLCHPAEGGPRSCSGCHLVTAPRNHTEQFKRRGHGLLVGLDRSSCQTCHESDFCIRCHENTRPISHRGSFGSPRNAHCLSCHEPVGSQPNCRICHPGTPSHFRGSPQPTNHVPGANCRLCHGFGAPLPHVDNGSECAACHP